MASSSCDLFRICHCNIHSLLGKVSELGVMAVQQNLDIICVTESWLDNSIPDGMVQLDGYLPPFRKDRDVRYGGVAVYVSNNISVSRVPELEQHDIECIWLLITLKGTKLLLGTFYRAPGANAAKVNYFLSSFSDMIDKVTRHKPSTVIITGDFNDRCHTWHDNHDHSELGLQLYNLLNSHNLVQVIDKPTRHSNLLDLMITDSPAFVRDSGVWSPISSSDHSVFCCDFSFKVSKCKTYKRKIWSYDRTDLPALQESLLNAPWHVGIATSDHIDDLYDYWHKLFVQCIESNIPNKTIIVRPRDKPWVTREIKRLITKRNTAWRRFQHSKNEHHQNLYKQIRNQVVAVNRSAYNEYCQKIQYYLTKTDPNVRKFWQCSRVLMGNKVCSSIPPILQNGKSVTDSSTKCELFNAYFCEQHCLPSDATEDSLPDFQLITHNKLTALHITPEQVLRVLLSLDVNKSVGPDNISNKMLKLASQDIAKPLDIFNYSLRTSTYPTVWKRANITPVFKKGNRQEVKNYRPISLLCNISKVFERLVFNHLYQYLVSNNLLTEKNSGYKKHDSTICQFLLLCDKIYKGIDEQKEVRMVFLDASKAFDRVWHAGLLFKLRQLGLTSSLVTWIQSYLSDRKQRVVLEGCSSSWLPVKAGVPQGSILGPLLFLVYTNDITDDITSDIHLYCDDTSLLSVATDPVVAAQRLNSDLNTLYKWSKQWFMVFNPSKTVSLTINNISKNHDNQPLMLENTLVSEVGEHTHLGVTFSKNMSWKAHINNLCKKASQRLGMMQVLKYSLSRDTLAHIYTAVVLPLFDYGDVIYNNCTSDPVIHLSSFT